MNADQLYVVALPVPREHRCPTVAAAGSIIGDSLAQGPDGVAIVEEEHVHACVVNSRPYFLTVGHLSRRPTRCVPHLVDIGANKRILEGLTADQKTRRGCGHPGVLGRSHEMRRGATAASAVIGGLAKNGVPEQTAQRVFEQVVAFSEFGFPKSHAAAFGLLAYQSAWLFHYHPVEYYAALFNNQPMGFYSIDALGRDAARHGIEVLLPDINKSDVWCTVEESSESSEGSEGSEGRSDRRGRWG